MIKGMGLTFRERRNLQNYLKAHNGPSSIYSPFDQTGNKKYYFLNQYVEILEGKGCLKDSQDSLT